MSRFKGPAGRHASRTLRAVRRAEAETRQAAYDALGARRGARRIKPGTAEYDKPEPLTATQLTELANTWQYGVRGFSDIADRPVDIPMPEAEARQCVEDCRLLGHQQPKTLVRRVALGPWSEVTL